MNLSANYWLHKPQVMRQQLSHLGLEHHILFGDLVVLPVRSQPIAHAVRRCRASITNRLANVIGAFEALTPGTLCLPAMLMFSF